MRKFPGALCKGKQGREYLAVYSFNHDVYVMPSEDMSGLERVAHVSYSKGKRKGGIDYFLIKEFDVESSVRVKKTILRQNNKMVVYELKAQKGKKKQLSTSVISDDVLRNADERYDLQTITIPLPQEMSDDIADFSRADASVFCGEDEAKEKRGVKTETVYSIIPITEVKRIRPKNVLTGGKQEDVPQCLLTANLDFGKGCISGFVPGDRAFFDGEFFHDFFAMPTGECHYCYAERNHKSFPKTLYVFDKQRLLDELRGNCQLKFGREEIHGKPVDILRFGKRTESWTPFTHDEFMQALDACAIVGTRGIIPTKFLPYLPEAVSPLKRTHSAVLFAVGDFERVERGAVMQGRTVNFRLEQLRRYHENGVNAIAYHMIVAHLPPTQRDLEILDFTRYGRKIPVQFLPMRFKGKDLVRQLCGEEWAILAADESQGTFDFFDSSYKSSYLKKKQSIIPRVQRIHPFWQNLVRNNNGRIRMCHHDDKYVLCGGCFQGKGLVDRVIEK